MTNSIHQQNIYDVSLERKVSPFQKKILDSYKLENETFVLTLSDSTTKDMYTFPRWESENNSDITVYDYIRRRQITIEDLENEYRKNMKANQKYDESLERTGL